MSFENSTVLCEALELFMRESHVYPNEANDAKNVY